MIRLCWAFLLIMLQRDAKEAKAKKDKEEAERKIQRLKEDEETAVEQLMQAEREREELDDELRLLEAEEKQLEAEEAEYVFCPIKGSCVLTRPLQVLAYAQ